MVRSLPKWVDRDLGWKEIERRIREVERKPHVSVGVQGTKAAELNGDSGITNGDIATIHEFGLGVEKRSFVLGYADEEHEAVRAKSRFLMQALLARKMTLKAALDTLGVFTKNGMKMRIKKHITPPNEPATIRKKKSNTPLIDTGALLASISYKTSSGGEG